MTTNVYAVLDIKAGAYMAPFTTSTHGLAMRMFEDLVKSEGTTPNKYPEDFHLHHLATFDDHKGQFTQDSPPLPLMTGAEIAAAQVTEPLSLEQSILEHTHNNGKAHD